MTAEARDSISACLIVRDEERNLPHALASVAFCDEAVVVDSGSVDGTVAVARRAGAVVVENPWPGFGAQRNVAADAATGDWILEVDADETITPELAAEILAFLATPGARDHVDILALPMRHRFLGADLGPSAQYPNYRTRMFRRGAYRHDEGRTVHEGLKPRAATHALRHDMVHVLADGWSEALGDPWRYARLEAGQFRPRLTPRTVAVGVLGRPAAKLLYRLVVDGAWRDGWRGVLKVGLDAGSDVLVWCRVLARRDAGDAPAGAGHLGEAMPAAGPIRIVALATSADGALRAARWVREAIALGAGGDSELVLPAGVETAAEGLFVRTAESAGPLGFARALMGAKQVRRIDAILLADAGARRVHRGLAAQVRGAAAPLDPAESPEAALPRLTRELR